MDRSNLEGLIARAGLGDRQAFAMLYDATSAKLFGICLRVLNNRSSAEDALQDTYVKIWANASRFVPGPKSPMTWLITIARNTSIDHLRAGKVNRLASELDVALASPAPGPEALAAAGSDAQRLLACLALLPADRAEAVREVYLKGETYANLAEKMSLPLNTVRTWLRRALMALRECMSDD